MQQIRDVLYESVEMHMRSNVPIGSFLSGGIDLTYRRINCKELKPDLKLFQLALNEKVSLKSMSLKKRLIN